MRGESSSKHCNSVLSLPRIHFAEPSPLIQSPDRKLTPIFAGFKLCNLKPALHNAILKFGAFIVACLASSCAFGQFLGPSPYLSQADSPFTGPAYEYFYLENFETGAFSVPGVTKSAGVFLGSGGSTDSVDADDGVIDGFGKAGRSLFNSAGSTGITFTFDSATLGSLPTYAGIVWTDGFSTITFEAFDINGASLGVRQGAHSDNSTAGTTGEDRIYGVVYEAGISKIKIKNSSGGIEVDHLQYGRPSARFSVSGNVQFLSLSNPARRPASVVVEFRPKGFAAGAFSRTTTLDASGNFTVENVFPLFYDVAVKADTWLAKKAAADMRVSNVSGLNYVLINGDADGDNYIGTDDYLIINGSFDKSLGDVGFLANADLNRDDYVGTDDYLIMNDSFDQPGE